MELTAENYYSPEANAEYMSVSQFKSFAGTDGKLACEAEAMAELRGEWEMKKTTALMVGSYVDSYLRVRLMITRSVHRSFSHRKERLELNIRKRTTSSRGLSVTHSL